MSNESSPSLELESYLEPYRNIHALMWQRIIDTHSLRGWYQAMYQLYFTMRATAPLLNFAADLAARDSRLTQFSKWAKSHAVEESEHADWFLDDLVSSGCSRRAIVENAPAEPIQDVIGSQFALAASGHPAAILGYFYAMECRPTDADLILVKTTAIGVPREAIRTILYHAKADVEHKVEITQLLDAYGLNLRLMENILVSAKRSVLGWSSFFLALASISHLPDCNKPLPSAALSLKPETK